MRIPSQFNDGSLYGRRGEDRESGGVTKRLAKRRLVASHHRQIIRMILALVLVFVVIGAAAKPQFYEPFFETEAVNAGLSNSEHVRLAGPAVVVPEETRKQSVEIASGLSAEEQVKAARALIRFRNGERDEALKAELSRVPIDLEDVKIEAMIETLIGESQKRVVDGAVWRGGDRGALRLNLLRFKQPSIAANDRPAAVVGALSLLQQPQAFLGQSVRVLGSVVRAELISEASTREVSGSETAVKKDPLPEYWQLWLRPSRGADRPIVALVTSVPDQILHFQEGASLNDAPKVIVQGTFLKRLAYRSSLGADLAPVVVGRLWQTNAPSITQNAEAGTQKAKAGRSVNSGKHGTAGVFAVIGGAVGMGIVLAGLVVWRTTQSAKHTRRIRREREVAALDVPLIVGNDSAGTNEVIVIHE